MNDNQFNLCDRYLIAANRGMDWLDQRNLSVNAIALLVLLPLAIAMLPLAVLGYVLERTSGLHR